VRALWLVALVGCAHPYAYSFTVAEPAAQEDADVKADLSVDPDASSIALTLTNKTDQILAIEWNELKLARAGAAGAPATVATLRPDSDLGWIQPGANLAAHLVPLALPRKGDDAAAYEGRRFEVTIPMLVRREAKVYRYALVAHVRKL
jgi:hypothetical protein